eukprot:TRINITY_DN9535_c0_g1_i2.p1 TRINITY_DN9535_c0_g1~~TRINITY_DN9535_c0_g1_i2.p1  ORF type:complete len:1139 (+),score=245.53 TRINITY_DN9535_c0_g1_i2:132-3419(+)
MVATPAQPCRGAPAAGGAAPAPEMQKLFDALSGGRGAVPRHDIRKVVDLLGANRDIGFCSPEDLRRILSSQDSEEAPGGALNAAAFAAVLSALRPMYAVASEAELCGLFQGAVDCLGEQAELRRRREQAFASGPPPAPAAARRRGDSAAAAGESPAAPAPSTPATAEAAAPAPAAAPRVSNLSEVPSAALGESMRGRRHAARPPELRAPQERPSWPPQPVLQVETAASPTLQRLQGNIPAQPPAPAAPQGAGTPAGGTPAQPALGRADSAASRRQPATPCGSQRPSTPAAAAPSAAATPRAGAPQTQQNPPRSPAPAAGPAPPLSVCGSDGPAPAAAPAAAAPSGVLCARCATLAAQLQAQTERAEAAERALHGARQAADRGRERAREAKAATTRVTELEEQLRRLRREVQKSEGAWRSRVAELEEQLQCDRGGAVEGRGEAAGGAAPDALARSGGAQSDALAASGWHAEEAAGGGDARQRIDDLSQQVWVLTQALQLRSRDADRHRDLLAALQRQLDAGGGGAALASGLRDMLARAHQQYEAEEEEAFGSGGAAAALADAAERAAGAPDAPADPRGPGPPPAPAEPPGPGAGADDTPPAEAPPCPAGYARSGGRRDWGRSALLGMLAAEVEALQRRAAHSPPATAGAVAPRPAPDGAGDLRAILQQAHQALLAHHGAGASTAAELQAAILELQRAGEARRGPPALATGASPQPPPDAGGAGLLHRLCCGRYTRWNVRAAPSAAAEVVALRADGDMASVTAVSEDGLWLWLKDQGWVRTRQGGAGWGAVAMREVPLPAPAGEGCTATDICGVDATGRAARLRIRLVYLDGAPPGSDGVLVGSVGADAPPGVAPAAAPRFQVLSSVRFDGERSLAVPELGVKVALCWEALPDALAAVGELLRRGGLPPALADPCVSIPVWLDGGDSWATEVPTAPPPPEDAEEAVAFGGAAFQWDTGAGQQAAPPRRGGSSAAAPPAELRRRLRRFFQFYRPEKLPSVVPTLAAAAAAGRGGCERVFAKLVAKYGPEPPAAAAEGPLRPGWREVELPEGGVFYEHAGGCRQWVRPGEFFTDGTVSPAALFHHGVPPPAQLEQLRSR